MRELNKHSLRQRPFALAIATFNAITKGKRNLTASLALKIESELGLEEGTLLILQAYYDIRKEKEKQKSHIPDLSILGKSLFWDTDINNIDWEEQYKAVIRRVFEREDEKKK